GLMKIVGAMMVIGASAWLGSLIANNYRQRPRLLGRFAQAVEMLRS
ncbi:MAG TPA: stage III sporulation protein AB, partial [Firmicutes bacterium]|nr:stage III sporulation protein AB [Bacillota bacterium]